MQKATKIILLSSFAVALPLTYIALSKSGITSTGGEEQLVVVAKSRPDPMELNNPTHAPAIPIDVYKEYLETIRSSNIPDEAADFFTLDYRQKFSMASADNKSEWLTNLKKSHAFVDLKFLSHSYQNDNTRALIQFTARTTSTLEGTPFIGTVYLALEDNIWKVTGEEYNSLLTTMDDANREPPER
jgi:hypothetical protein